MWVYIGFCVCMSNYRAADRGKIKTFPLWTFPFLLLLFPPASACTTQRASQTERNPNNSSISISPTVSPLASSPHPDPPRTIDFPTPSTSLKGKDWGGFSFCATMEIQSGNGEEVASTVSATSGFVSRSPSGSQVEASDDPARRDDLQAAKRIERFDIPLDSLKRMFEKPAGANTVSTTAVEMFNFTFF